MKPTPMSARAAFDPDIRGFANEAFVFCTWVDDAGTLPLDVRTRDLAARLVALYAAALALPSLASLEALEAVEADESASSESSESDVEPRFVSADSVDVVAGRVSIDTGRASDRLRVRGDRDEVERTEKNKASPAPPAGLATHEGAAADAAATILMPTRTWAGLAEQTYWEVFDPFVDEPPVCGDLDDDVLDIVGDLQNGLEHWRKGRHAKAAYEWRLAFDNHWGDHLVDALRAIHRLVTRARATAE